MENRVRKHIALALAVIMFIGMLPMNALAALIRTDYSSGISVMSVTDQIPDTHTYTFRSLDTAGNMVTVSTQIVKNGETLFEPAAPEPPNKKFVGWYLEGTDTPVRFGPTTVASTQKITVEARYADVVYVYYWHDDTNDGIENYTVISTKEVIPGHTTDGSQVPVVTRPGKVFSHWSAAPGGTEIDFNQLITENTNLYAVLADQWVVDFNAKGGTPIEEQHVNYNATATVPAQPTKAGYTFRHWSLTDGGTAFDFSTPITKDTTLYAVWTPATAKYIVVYWQENANDNGYSIAEIVNKTGTTGTDAAYDPRSYTGFHLESTKTDNAKTTIAGDGTTIRNVYYARNTWTLTIEYLPRGYSNVSWNWSTISTTEYKYGQTTGTAYYAAMYNTAYQGYLWYISRTSSTAYGEAPDMPNSHLTISGRYSGNYKYVTRYHEKTATGEVSIHPDFIYYANRGRGYTIEDGVAIKGFTVVTPVTQWKNFAWNSTDNAYYGTI